MSTVQQLINMVDIDFPNAEQDTTKVAYMNLAIDEISDYFGLEVEDSTLVTVATQDEYALPVAIRDISQIISLAVAWETSPTDRYSYTKYVLAKREDNPMQYNSYYQVVDSSGVRKLVIYPVPATSGFPIRIRYHKKIAPLVSTSLSLEPEFDSEFHSMLALFCCHKLASAGASPNTLQSDKFLAEYDQKLAKLWKRSMEKDVKTTKRKTDNRQWHRYSSYSAGD